MTKEIGALGGVIGKIYEQNYKDDVDAPVKEARKLQILDEIAPALFGRWKELNPEQNWFYFGGDIPQRKQIKI